MTKIMKARKSGFTLVELLIVIMIIAILAGMTMLATGAAIDGAEAARVINDLLSMKAAAIMFCLDEGHWPDEAAGSGAFNSASALARSFDRYTDRPLLGGAGRYASIQIDSGNLGSTPRTFIGLELAGNTAKAGVRQKLRASAQNSGLYGTPAGGGTPMYDGAGNVVWTVMY
ncbi:MAG: type II secretion system GspH family protein [Syntrophomonadaceae bacterium]|jgi:general secretion pathway protein G|nr:type II secretion system GspH family protein [Syntrophomonadaceae bacterium]